MNSNKISKRNVQPLADAFLHHLSNLIFSLFACEDLERRSGIALDTRAGRSNDITTRGDMSKEEKCWMLDYFYFVGKHHEVPQCCYDPRKSNNSNHVVCKLAFRSLDEYYTHMPTISPKIQLLWINDLVDFIERRTESAVSVYGELVDHFRKPRIACYFGYGLDDDRVNHLLDYKSFETFNSDDGSPFDEIVTGGYGKYLREDEKFSHLSNFEKCLALEWLYMRENNNLFAYTELANAYIAAGMTSTAELLIWRAYTSSSVGANSEDGFFWYDKKTEFLEDKFPEITSAFARKYGRPKFSSLDRMADSMAKDIIQRLNTRATNKVTLRDYESEIPPRPEDYNSIPF